MYLTLVNMANKKGVIPYMFRGKYRKVKKVEFPALKERYHDVRREEKNMFILRHPYLTVEQSTGYMAEFKNPTAYKEHWNVERNEKLAKKSISWAEQLSHLRVKDAWD